MQVNSQFATVHIKDSPTLNPMHLRQRSEELHAVGVDVTTNRQAQALSDIQWITRVVPWQRKAKRGFWLYPFLFPLLG